MTGGRDHAVFTKEDHDASNHDNEPIHHNALLSRDSVGAHPATAVSFTPSGTVAATDVQAAIVELDTEKETPAGAQAKANAAQTAANAHSDAADAAHLAAGDPHAQYESAGEAQALVDTHRDATGPHPNDTHKAVSIIAASIGAQPLNVAIADVFDVTLNAANTIFSVTNPHAALNRLVLIIRQPIGGGKTISFAGTTIAWDGGVAPPLAAAGGTVLVVELISTDGGVTWFGFPGDSNHHVSHQPGGSDEILSLALTTLIVPSAASPAETTEASVVWDTDDDKLTVGTGAARKTLVNDDDARMTDARTPTGHHASHDVGGGDAIASVGATTHRHANPNGIGVALRETTSSDGCGSDLALVSTQREQCFKIELEAGDPVGHIGWVMGAQAMVTPTNWWFTLRDSAGALLAWSGDQGNAAGCAADAPQELAITKDAAGNALAQYVAPARGTYYIGISVNAVTPPSLSGKSTRVGVMGIAPVKGFRDTSVVTNTPEANVAQNTILTNMALGYVRA